jgi:O-antigen ligase
MMIGGIFLIIVCYAVLGLVFLGQFGDTLLGIPKWAYERVATGPFVNRNSYATYLSFGLAIGVALAIGRLEHGEDDRNRFRAIAGTVLVAVGLVVVAAALVATQSRMGFFAGLVGALVVTVLALAGGRVRRGVWLTFVVVLLASVIGLLAFNGEGLLERVGSVESAGDVRFDLYRQVWSMIMASPYLGYGGGTFEAAFPLFHQLPVNPDVVWNKAHSTYLALWSELGLVAGSAPLFIVGAATLRIVLSRGRRATRPIKLAATGVVTVAAVHSLVDFSLEIQAVALVFVAVLSLAIGAGFGDSDRSKADA